MTPSVRSHDQQSSRNCEVQDWDERILEADAIKVGLGRRGEKFLDLDVPTTQLLECLLGIDGERANLSRSFEFHCDLWSDSLKEYAGKPTARSQKIVLR